MARKELTKAIAYFRTSSATNAGEDKDTLKRQRTAVEAFAKAADYELIAEYRDDAVKGSDPVDQRPGERRRVRPGASATCSAYNPPRDRSGPSFQFV